MTAAQLRAQMTQQLCRRGDAVIPWTDILAFPNGAKTFEGRMSRNRTTACELIQSRFLKRPTAGECQAYRARFERQTERMVRHLVYYTGKRKWEIVTKLADALSGRRPETDLFVIGAGR